MRLPCVLPSFSPTGEVWVFLGVVLAFCLGCFSPVQSAMTDASEDRQTESGQRHRFTLTVLHNNDGESELLPTPVAAEQGPESSTEGGVAHFASVLERTRKAVPKDRDHTGHGIIFVSSGDNFLAGPAFTASVSDGVFYDARALDMLSYDAIDLGNHDFDFGPELLARFISEGFVNPGTPPYLSANLDFSGEPVLEDLYDKGVIARSTVVERGGEKIGIVGATTPKLAIISSPRNVVVMPDLAAVVQEQVDELEAAGIDKIVLISHLQDVDADLALIPMLSGVDVTVAGGGDELLANCRDMQACKDLLVPSDNADENPVDGVPDELFGPYPLIATDADGRAVPVVTTAGQYKYLGRLTIGFDETGHVVWTDGDSGPIRVVSRHFPDGVNANREFQQRVEAPVRAFVAGLDATVIATSEVALNGRRNPGVRTMETNQGNLIADALRWQAQQLVDGFDAPVPDVALQNGGGIRNDSIIPAGDITRLDTFNMVRFANFLAVVPGISRETFKEILENTVSRTQPGDTSGGTGRFAQISGFRFQWSLSGTAQVIDPDGNIATPGTRVRRVTLDDGTVIAADGAVVAGPAVTVATVDFLARGGDQYPFGGTAFRVLGVSYQEALENYLMKGLDGVITAADYPEGGEGRNVPLP